MSAADSFADGKILYQRDGAIVTVGKKKAPAKKAAKRAKKAASN